MSEPTEAQIKEFWKWCGFVSCYKSVAPEETGIDYWMQPPDSEKTIPIPDIDLNNLFKYAVPKLGTIRPIYQVKHLLGDWIEAVIIYDKAPALALFWALWQVKEKSNE